MDGGWLGMGSLWANTNVLGLAGRLSAFAWDDSFQVERGKKCPWSLNLEALGESERFRIPRGLVSFVLPTDIDVEFRKRE